MGKKASATPILRGLQGGLTGDKIKKIAFLGDFF
jgi:hypothetical protein